MFTLHDYQQTLVDKTRQAYVDGYKAPCVVAPCGAGKSIIISDIAKNATNKSNKVLFLVHRRELIDQIKDTFIKNNVNLDYVHFGMVQTVVRQLDKMTKPKLIIVDENHHSLANSYKKIFDYFSDVPSLGFTATPIRLNGSGLGDVNDILIEEVNAKWLIENNYLSPYKYYAPKLIDTEKLKMNSLREFSSTSMDNAMEEKTIYGDAVKHYKKLADGEQAIAYCHSVESSKHTAEQFMLHGINAAHLDGTTPKDKRDSIINQFRTGEIKVLTNCDIVGEGFDVPECSTVIMLRPTQSLSLFIQQSMRGMRYKKGKTSIIIDHVDNVRRHGLPDTERLWSLKGIKKQESENEIKIKECENCFGVYTPEYLICPHCGHKPEVKEAKGYEVNEDASLEEINEDEISQVVTLDFREPEDCKNMAELTELAKNRGYKKGWIYYQGKARGFI